MDFFHFLRVLYFAFLCIILHFVFHYRDCPFYLFFIMHFIPVLNCAALTPSYFMLTLALCMLCWANIFHCFSIIFSVCLSVFIAVGVYVWRLCMRVYVLCVVYGLLHVCFACLLLFFFIVYTHPYTQTRMCVSMYVFIYLCVSFFAYIRIFLCMSMYAYAL